MLTILPLNLNNIRVQSHHHNLTFYILHLNFPNVPVV